MAPSDAAADAPRGATLEALEALQTQTPHNRRPRPPDLLPQKPEKLNKRESRGGLRGLFSRSRPPKDGDAPQSPRPRDPPRSAGVRSSWVDLGGWSLQHQRSEGALPPVSAAGPVEPASIQGTRQKKSHSTGKAAAPAGKANQTGADQKTANWDPPPLFQAYPQAIRHAHISACKHSADAILRMNPNQESIHDDEGGKSAEKRRKHRRNSPSHSDWTTKVYVLVTSGYLLQYAGEGSFDRLPDKVLQLGKDSAVFVSDAIPGRHWVLRIAQTMEPSPPPIESRSLFSRIPFRPGERRHASNLLMVFDGVEDMEGWLSVLRKEIEALGGKKHLSETGKPKAEDDQLQLKAQVSQRTLVVRDPDRFSRPINPQDLTWQHRQSMSQETVEPRSPATVVESEATPEHSPDDISTTNSFVSHDGRQLENLRDSAGANRFSYISSGQRTIITSAGSSPACSPTRDSFASNVDELSLRDSAPAPVPEVRLRPNAAAISDRRQSMQTMSPFIDSKAAASHRPHSAYVPAPMDDAVASYGPTTPNFSVPHGVSKRYSLAKPPPEGAGSAASPPFLSPEQPTQTTYQPRPSSRRCPPAGLGMSRPLSIVADQPSPIPEIEPSTHPTTSYLDHSPNAEDAATVVSRPPTADSRNDLRGRAPQAGFASNDDLGNRSDGGYNPRKAMSMNTLRESSEITAEEHIGAVSEHIKGARRVIFTPPRESDPVQRCRSSTGYYERSRSQSPSTRQAKRASLQPMSTPPQERRSPRFSLPGGSAMSSTRSSTMALLGLNQPSQRAFSPPPPAHPASGQFMAVGDSEQSKGSPNCMSIPQLADGPPPAPPPTCALPPIPQRMRFDN